MSYGNGSPPAFMPNTSNMSASWSIALDSTLQGNCSGTPPPGVDYFYSSDVLSKVSPSGQDWSVALPQGFSFLPNPGSNPSCTVDSFGQVYFYAGGPSGNRVFSLNSSGALLWTLTPPGMILAGISSETSDSGDIYVTGFLSCECNQTIVAVNPEGQLLWNASEPLSQYGIHLSSLVPMLSPNGTILLSIQGFDNGTDLIAMNPNDGIKLWSFLFDTQDHILGPIFSSDGTMYVWDETTLFAFTGTGGLEWQTYLSAGFRGQFPGQIIINSNSTLLVNLEYPSTFLEINSSNGQEIWNATLNTNLVYLSWLLGVGSDGSIFVQQFKWSGGVIMSNSTLFGYSSNGTMMWTLPTILQPPSSIGGPNLLVDNSGDALVLGANNTLYSVASTGSSVWQIQLPANLKIAGIDSGTPTYIWLTSSSQNELYAIDAEPYSPLSTAISYIVLPSSTTSSVGPTTTYSIYQTTSTQTSNTTSTAPIEGGINWPLIFEVTIVATIVMVATYVFTAVRRR